MGTPIDERGQDSGRGEPGWCPAPGCPVDRTRSAVGARVHRFVGHAGIVRATMEFRVSRAARDRHAFDATLFSTRGDTITANPAAARRFAQQLIATGGVRPGRYVQAGDIGAMGLIHELFHVAIDRSRQGAAGAGPLEPRARRTSRRSSQTAAWTGRSRAWSPASRPRTSTAANARRRTVSPPQSHGVTGREEALEELLLLWVENQNPAFLVYDDLVGDAPLAVGRGLPGRGGRAAASPCRARGQGPGRGRGPRGAAAGARSRVARTRCPRSCAAFATTGPAGSTCRCWTA